MHDSSTVKILNSQGKALLNMSPKQAIFFKLSLLFSLIVLRAAWSELPEHEIPLEFELEVGWDSRYMNEGRDELDGDSLVATTLSALYKDLGLGFWYAASPDDDYREYEIFTFYTFNWHEMEVCFCYTHLRVPGEKEHDNELQLEFISPPLPGDITAAFAATWSFNASGAFFEASLCREFELTDYLALAPIVTLGWNEGFVEDGHYGANHFAVGLESCMSLKPNCNLVLKLSQSFAIDANPDRYSEDELLKDCFTVGLGLQAKF